MTAAAGIVPSFFLSCFECSTFDWRDQGRRDLVVETQHRRHARADYELLCELSIPWPLVERRSAHLGPVLTDLPGSSSPLPLTSRASHVDWAVSGSMCPWSAVRGVRIGSSWLR